LLTDCRRKFQTARNFNVSDFQTIDRDLSHMERPQSAFAENQPPNRQSTYRQSAHCQAPGCKRSERACAKRRRNPVNLRFSHNELHKRFANLFSGYIVMACTNEER
jgi:hypothetical protein